MTDTNNHPKRSKLPEGVPTPEEIKAARIAAGLTQVEAAALVRYAEISWKQWEGGSRPMAWATWFAFTTLASAMRAAPPNPKWREQGVALADVVGATCPVCGMGIDDGYCTGSNTHAGFHAERVAVARKEKAARE